MDNSKALKNWTTLNDALRACTEAEAAALLKAELRGTRRTRFLVRIHARFKRLRDTRERQELTKKR